MLSKCKQSTVSGVVSGRHFSGPSTDQIRRKSGALANAQIGQDLPPFGISDEPWVRLRWGERSAREVIRGGPMAAIVKWFGSRQLQDLNPSDKWSVGTASWWTTDQPQVINSF